MSDRIRGFELVSYEAKKKCVEICKDSINYYCDLSYEESKMPLRGTKKSSGYDFHNISREFVIPPMTTVIIWTGIKAYMQDNEFLMLLPRSSAGIKKNLVLANTVGDIDSDYYNNESNEGNIAIALKNAHPTESVLIKSGEAIVQAIFMPFLVSDNCNTKEERKGGCGSTSEVK